MIAVLYRSWDDCGNCCVRASPMQRSAECCNGIVLCTSLPTVKPSVGCILNAPPTLRSTQRVMIFVGPTCQCSVSLRGCWRQFGPNIQKNTARTYFEINLTGLLSKILGEPRAWAHSVPNNSTTQWLNIFYISSSLPKSCLHAFVEMGHNLLPVI
jgi:hypothetical protein